MSSEFKNKPVTVKSTGEKGIIEEISPRRSGTGAMSIRYIVQVENGGPRYACMPHEVIVHEAPMMGMSY